MSLCIRVFLHKERLPSRTAWGRATSDCGWTLSFPDDFDPNTHTGYLPCLDSGAGFEYYVEPIQDAGVELDTAARALIGGRDAMVSFVFRREDELAPAQTAAASLACVADGILLDEEAGEFIEPAETLKWAANQAYRTAHRYEHTKAPPKSAPRKGVKIRILILIVGALIGAAIAYLKRSNLLP